MTQGCARGTSDLVWRAPTCLLAAAAAHQRSLSKRQAAAGMSSDIPRGSAAGVRRLHWLLDAVTVGRFAVSPQARELGQLGGSSSLVAGSTFNPCVL